MTPKQSQAQGRALIALTLISSAPRNNGGGYLRDREACGVMANAAMQDMAELLGVTDVYEASVGPAMDAAVSALTLISAPRRADGTYNRERAAVAAIARDALDEIDTILGAPVSIRAKAEASAPAAQSALPSSGLPQSSGAGALRYLRATPRVMGPLPDDAPYVVYTDGASKGNPGPASWGVCVLEAEGAKYTPTNLLHAEGGYIGEETNQVAELMGGLEGLRSTPVGARVVLISDSKYLLDGLASWRKNWARNGWLKADKQPVANKDIWEALSAEADKRLIIEFRHVRGHSGEQWNELCDTLANEAVAARGSITRT